MPIKALGCRVDAVVCLRSRAVTRGGPPDDALLFAAKRGDGPSVAVLFRDLHPRINRYLRGQEPNAADDIEGDVWEAIARGARRLHGLRAATLLPGHSRSPGDASSTSAGGGPVVAPMSPTLTRCRPFWLPTLRTSRQSTAVRPGRDRLDHWRRCRRNRPTSSSSGCWEGSMRRRSATSSAGPRTGCGSPSTGRCASWPHGLARSSM